MTAYTPDTLPETFAAGDIIDIAYSGSGVGFRLPRGKWKLEVWGAQGGYRSSSSYGGLGGYAQGILRILEGTQVYCYAGGSGTTGGASESTSTGRGGFNGGGLRAYYPGGGGGSDIRVGQDSLYARIIVAGGGGSDGGTSNAGGAAGIASSSGSGSNDGAGADTYSGASSSTTATEQTDDVATSTARYGGFGFGGNGLFYSRGYGGAGGGGWYGGSGSYPSRSATAIKGGSGGSGYVWTEETVGNYPDGCLLDVGWHLSDAAVQNGNETFSSPSGDEETGHAGDGHVRLTLIELVPFTATFVVAGETSTADVLPGESVTFPSPPAGYVITGWTVSGGAIDPEGFTITEDTTFVATGEYRCYPGDQVTWLSDITLYAIWAPISVSMTPNPVDAGKSVIVTVGIGGS